MKAKKIQYKGQSIQLHEDAYDDFRQATESLPFIRKSFEPAPCWNPVKETRLFLQWIEMGNELRYPEY